MSDQASNSQVDFIHQLKLIDALGEMAILMDRRGDFIECLEQCFDRANKEPLLLSCEQDLLQLVKDKQDEFCNAVRKAAERKAKASNRPYPIRT